MSHTKKIIVMFLVSAILGGGAWYLNTTGVLSGISSSVIPPFVCTESNLKEQAPYYRQSQVRWRKAVVIQRQLETEIVTLRSENQVAEMKKKQATLRILTRQIATYNRFIKAYVACQKKTPLPLETAPPETTAELDVVSDEGDDASEETGETTVSTPTVIPPDTTIPPVSSIPEEAPVTTDPVIVIEPPTTEPPTTTLPPQTTEIPETTEAPVTTAVPETTEAPTTTPPETTEPATTTEEYIPETTEPASVIIPSETTETAAPSEES